MPCPRGATRPAGGNCGKLNGLASGLLAPYCGGRVAEVLLRKACCGRLGRKQPSLRAGLQPKLSADLRLVWHDFSGGGGDEETGPARRRGDDTGSVERASARKA